MKLVLKRVVIVLAVVMVLVIGAVGWLILAFPKSRTAPDIEVELTPERVARGSYIFNHVSDCAGCHSDHLLDRFALPVKPGTEGQGGLVFDAGTGVPGIVAAQNITPDPETGIGAWTDGEIIRAIREGVSRDGRPLFPMMPYEGFAHMSDEDVQALVAYMKTLPPVRNEVPKTRIDFPVNLFIRMVPKPLPEPVPHPDPEKDYQAYARYVTTLAGCGDCHTPRDDKGAPIFELAFSGGWEMVGPWGRVVTPNLTPHPDTWMGTATKEQFVGRFRAFAGMDAQSAPVAPQGQNTVMPWLAFSGMTDQDLGAIYDYLKSLEPIENRVTVFPDAPRPGGTSG